MFEAGQLHEAIQARVPHLTMAQLERLELRQSAQVLKAAVSHFGAQRQRTQIGELLNLFDAAVGDGR